MPENLVYYLRSFKSFGATLPSFFLFPGIRFSGGVGWKVEVWRWVDDKIFQDIVLERIFFKVL